MSNTSITRASVGRTIPTAPLRILDAPDLVDDYYLNLISWGHNNVRVPFYLIVSFRRLIFNSSIATVVTWLCNISTVWITIAVVEVFSIVVAVMTFSKSIELYLAAGT